MIIYSGCKSTKKISFTLRFLMFFFATACIADFHISFAAQCSSKYIGVREIRHTGKVISRFAHSCPRLWVSLPNYVGHLYPRLCPQLPKTLGIFAQLRGASLPKALGTVTQDFGHPYPCTWVWKPVYVGMSIHGRGQNCSALARCLLGRGNRWH